MAVSLTGGTATFDNKNVGTAKTVTGTGFTLSGANAGNYVLGTVAATTADITGKTLVVRADASDKVYDGTTTASATAAFGTGGTGVFPGDVVSLAVGAATFDTRTVGTGKTVTVPVSLSGAQAGNYSVPASVTTTASITAKSVTATFTAASKIYDGTATATITGSSVAGAIMGDAVSLTGATAMFANKNVGTGKTVTAAGASLTGADAANYSLGSVAATTADITTRSLAVTATGVNKVYDGNASTTATLGDDRVSGDVLTTGYASASFDNKNVGTGKPVSVAGISISGADAGNYSLAATTASTTANITAKSITGSFTAANKVYDGGTVATITDRALVGAIGTDAVSLTGGTAAFEDKNVGTGKTVTATGLALGGTDAGNYTLGSVATTTADITAKALTGSITASNKVYDGTTSATVASQPLPGTIMGDDVTLVVGAASFANKNVGTGKTVSAGLSLTGGDALNYTVNATAGATADITPRTLTVSAAGVNKVYDGTMAATVTLADNRVSGDVFTAGYATASFADKNVGDGKAVSVSGISISGTDAGNYTVNETATTTASISKAELTIAADNKSMNFGDALRPAFTVTPTGLVNGEPISVLGGTLTFAGTATMVTATSFAGPYTITPLGLTSGNYAITFAGGTLTVVDRSAPIVTNALATPNPVAVTTATGTTITATVSDASTGNTNIASAAYSLDGGRTWSTAPMSAKDGAFNSPTEVVTKTLNLATGVYNVCVRGTDAATPGNTSAITQDNTDDACTLLAVYDPSAGFVTGGGWINSPTGAYAAEPTLTGKATFGFVSKYQKGQTIPSGNTQFQFHAAGFDFKSTVYEWLVISGARAQYKGSGTINGSGDYGFILTAVDGQVNGGGGTDFFRMKVTNKTTGAVIYDNMVGAGDDTTPGPSSPGTLLGGGSIQIQAK